ncbi:MAG: T9SS type A sorting domain-containing protein, partial [Candidatus Kapaibacterium sp.]
PQQEDIEVVLHYDGRMTYNSSRSLSGNSFDLSGEVWQGRAKIRIPKNEMQLDTISGFAIFTVFPDGTDCFKVTIDSMSILSPFAPCSYSIGNPVTSTICPPRGCGIMTLTNYMRHGTMPQLSIQPNPSRGMAWITSNITIGDASIEIADMLGRIQNKIDTKLEKGIPAKLEFGDLLKGSYFLRIHSLGSLYQIPFAIIR